MATRVQDLLAGAREQLRFEPTPKRIRALSGDRTVVDSRAAVLVWEPRRVVPSYAVPEADLVGDLVPDERPAPEGRPGILTPRDPFTLHSTPGGSLTVRLPERDLVGAAFRPADPDLAGMVVLDWTAFDQWLEEDQQAIGSPRDPFSRIDCLPTDRHVVVSHRGLVLADTRRAIVLFETGLSPRYYIPREDVATDLLVPTDSHTVCAYKGRASYWSASVGDETLPDVVWSYEEPLHDGLPVKGLLAFYTERLELTVDGVGL
ncbi:DUF427 domain-containing protein [Raineyella fluvialis]|uniref:DUF427 domain-containing protein n=1 Tax=Raineyella fluvialis TaxID=2662261 RepID=A0A5Q2FBU3_9ACTN|nr:DUF427 domain-containing protein [Raineyella fluvialis]QGF22884.1 DUF427 domain-containing protein [Raineyella fluvialis]